jgi:hypothetical protein
MLKDSRGVALDIQPQLHSSSRVRTFSGQTQEVEAHGECTGDTDSLLAVLIAHRERSTKRGTAVAPITLRSKNGFELKEAEIRDVTGQVTDRIYIVMSPDGEEVLFESPKRPEAEKAFERLTN